MGEQVSGGCYWRLRKKLHIDEFQELGFTVAATLATALDDVNRYHLTDAFLEECIEANNMLFGSGINQGLDGFVVSSFPRGSANDEQRECVREWLQRRSEFSAVSVGPLVDAWHGHDR